jgi:cellulose synthase/poly-beta-1,6-N-acetylglucosamine synthase-like glycosyltransferase
MFARRLSAYGLPVIIVDDGNDDESKAYLADCAANTPQTVLINFKKNKIRDCNLNYVTVDIRICGVNTHPTHTITPKRNYAQPPEDGRVTPETCRGNDS